MLGKRQKKIDKGSVEELKEMIKKTVQDNTLVIVEGYKDKKALTALGFNPLRIIPLARRALYKVVEQVIEKEKTAVILTDLDKAGKLLYSRLNSDLTQRGIHIDNTLRHFLFRHTRLRQIEGLKNYIDRNTL